MKSINSIKYLIIFEQNSRSYILGRNHKLSEDLRPSKILHELKYEKPKKNLIQLINSQSSFQEVP